MPTTVRGSAANNKGFFCVARELCFELQYSAELHTHVWRVREAVYECSEYKKCLFQTDARQNMKYKPVWKRDVSQNMCFLCQEGRGPLRRGCWGTAWWSPNHAPTFFFFTLQSGRAEPTNCTAGWRQCATQGHYNPFHIQSHACEVISNELTWLIVILDFNDKNHADCCTYVLSAIRICLFLHVAKSIQGTNEHMQICFEFNFHTLK